MAQDLTALVARCEGRQLPRHEWSGGDVEEHTPGGREGKRAWDAYNPDQPRDPEGTPTGGQWTSGGSAAAALTKDEVKAISEYDTSSTGLNQALRAGASDDDLTKRERAMRDGLDSALAKASLGADITVYRGSDALALGEKIAEAWNHAGGGDVTFEDLGFMTTSASKSVADRFGPVQFVLKLPKGAKAMALGDMVRNKDEEQVLLARGSKFKVSKVERRQRGNTNGYVVHGELI